MSNFWHSNSYASAALIKIKLYDTSIYLKHHFRRILSGSSLPLILYIVGFIIQYKYTIFCQKLVISWFKHKIKTKKKNLYFNCKVCPQGLQWVTAMLYKILGWNFLSFLVWFLLCINIANYHHVVGINSMSIQWLQQPMV